MTMINDAHARPSGDVPAPLYDVDVAMPSHAERARTLVAQITTGTLCTLAAAPQGYPSQGPPQCFLAPGDIF